MNNGWIKLHRQLLEWEWYDDTNVVRFFLHCILRANHAEKKWRGITIKRGQFYTSLDSLVKETGLSTSQIRTCFDKLKSTGEIASSSQARGRMVTVKNYEQYQCDDRMIAGSSQGDSKVVATNKNDKKEKNDKNDKNKEFDFPFQTKQFSEAWSDWVIYRKEIKKPLTDTAIKKQLNILKEMTEANAIESITNSISNGWAGLFEVKATKGKIKTPKQLEEWKRAL